MATARRAWRAGQPELDPARLVFADHTGASCNVARLYGRSPRGERCVPAVPHGNWKTTTSVGGLRLSGTPLLTHMPAAVRSVIEIRGAELGYVPPYSPDRDGVCQVECAAQKGRGPHGAILMESHRTSDPTDHSQALFFKRQAMVPDDPSML